MSVLESCADILERPIGYAILACKGGTFSIKKGIFLLRFLVVVQREILSSLKNTKIRNSACNEYRKSFLTTGDFYTNYQIFMFGRWEKVWS